MPIKEGRETKKEFSAITNLEQSTSRIFFGERRNQGVKRKIELEIYLMHWVPASWTRDKNNVHYAQISPGHLIVKEKVEKTLEKYETEEKRLKL